MIFQEPLSALNPLLTVGEQIEEVMRVHNAYPEQESAQRVLDVLEFVGLPDPRLIRRLAPSACPAASASAS